MSRRSIPAKKLDERTFAVRIRVAVPERGLKCLNDLYAWLKEKAPNDYALHSTTAGVRQRVHLHTNDPSLAVECISTFGLDIYELPKETL